MECRNQFGQHEPGTAEIRQFCTKNYGVDFDLFRKIEVNCDDACPLYKHLTQLETKPKGSGKVSWNLENFLLDRNGEVIARFEPRTRPDAPEVSRLIDSNLAEKQLDLGQRHVVLWRVNLSPIVTLFNLRSFVSELTLHVCFQPDKGEERMIRTIALLMVVAVVFVATGTATALDIGDKAPNFTATGVNGKEFSLESISRKGDLVVVCFTCNKCPVAVAYEDRLIEFNKKYQGKNVQFIALNCNNRTEGLEVMKQRAEEKGFNFVYAFDESGNAAKEYGAKVTPELFVIKDGKIAYHGAYDDNMKEPTKTHLVSAVDSLLADQTPEVAETKAFGCSIKLK